MSDALRTIEPTRSAAVFASAGTGKTWLLTARILRLLLHGEPPGSILALSFTRKAAAEIRQRLIDKLATWVTADDGELRELLAEIGIANASTAQLEQARALYEQVQFADHSIRTATLDSFFRELLQRFPLEAGMPVNFHMVDEEQSDLLQQEAQRQLVAEAAGDPELQQSLRFLRNYLVNPFMFRQMLRAFLTKSLEWQIFCADRSLEDLTAELEKIFKVSKDDWDFMHPFALQIPPTLRLAELLDVISASPRSNQAKMAIKLRDLCDAAQRDDLGAQDDVEDTALPHDYPFWLKWEEILFQDGTIKATCGDLKKTHQDRLKKVTAREEYAELLTNLAITHEIHFQTLRSRFSFAINRHYYHVCTRLLVLYQEIKYHAGAADFDDLRWNARQLMLNNDSEWIQYKLSQRIKHILVDEFQDTDNLSWQVLKPFLESFEQFDTADGARSAFIVGDTKQSIYQWRRANPEIQQAAAQYLQLEAGAEPPLEMAASRRSSQVVIDFVNRYFEQDNTLLDFPQHATHENQLWGRVELLPMVEEEKDEDKDEDEQATDDALRNPLTEPRQVEAPALIRLQAEQVAARLRELIDSGYPIREGDSARPAQWKDVMVLVRARTHLDQVEHAFAAVGIPFARQSRETLLTHLEVLDMLALLRVLIDPEDSLRLAQVLRSPLYGATDEHLIELARADTGHRSWYNRLQDIARDKPDHVLAHAAAQLETWRQYLDHVPTHDLLDRVYFEADVLRRYRAAWPEKDADQAVSNLVYFMELALAHNQGRYPSTPAFVHYIEQMRARKIKRPDAPSLIFPPQDDQRGRVEILTVHAAKGLEAPIVVYVSLTEVTGRGQPGTPLLEWPAHDERPLQFLMRLRSAHLDKAAKELIELQDDARDAEAHHIDYVAFTRAKQVLILCEQKEKRENMLHAIGTAIADDQGRLVHEMPPPSDLKLTAPPKPQSTAPDDLAPLRAVPTDTVPPRYRLSHFTQPEALEFGSQIHRILELLGGAEPDNSRREDIAQTMRCDPAEEQFTAAWEEAVACVTDEGLAAIFRPDAATRVYREVPLTRLDGDEQEYGIVDLLLVGPDRVQIIDYKSHRSGSADTAALTAQYREQMERYARCVRAIYPERSVECALLLTADRSLLPVVPAADY